MRLTTVTRMELPDGVVHRYVTKISPAQDADLPPSFDQARHASLGPRAGSWMALAFTLPPAADRDLVARAWLGVIERHGTLRTVLEGGGRRGRDGAGRGVGHGGGDDDEVDDELRLRPVTVQPLGWRVPRTGPGEDPRAVVRRVFDEACSPFARPAHALCLVQPTDPRERPVVVIGFDHSHVDAWSLLVVMRDLCSGLDDLARGREPAARLPPAAPFAEHTAELAARPPAPARVHEKWAGIMDRGAGGMPVFPLNLGDISAPREQVVEVRDVLDPDGVAALEAAAAAGGVRMIALAVAEMTEVLRRRAGVGLRAVLPVHSRHDPDRPHRWDDSVGWFITNSVIECDDPDPAACAAAVREAIELGSHALAPILAPYGGMPHTPGMFAVSWLDHRRLPIDVDLDLRPQHVSAVIRTDGVMVWFVVNGSGLHVRCRYPDTPAARASVGGWLDELCAGLVRRALGALSPAGAGAPGAPGDPGIGDPDALSGAPPGPGRGRPASRSRPATARA